MNYVAMDTSNIVLWVLVCVRNMNVAKNLLLQHFKVIYIESLLKQVFLCTLIRFVF